uniref:Translation initiation factor IF-2 n=1 Tax=Candidatus Aschnera chinzeii TaxID=1485666 RepID=A0AAT9G5B6_9ENTR|nr:MAG: translation initiation factor IF-2 [Candidatus Aschnera chinzeii]
MADETVKSLAIKIKTSIEYLIEQFSNAGIKKNATDIITPHEKNIFFAYLSKKNNINADTLTLQRKTKSVLNVLGIGGKSKSINVEVRKKHIYINHELINNTHITKKNINDIKSDPTHFIEDEISHQSLQSNNTINDHPNTVLNINDYNNTNNKNKKQKTKNEITKLKNKNNVYGHNKKNNDTKNIIKKTHPFHKETHTTTWCNINNIHDDEDYSINNSRYSREVDDINHDHQENKRNKNKQWKNNKNKKNNKFFDILDDKENALHDEETQHIIKNKNKSNSALQHGFNKPISNIMRNVIIGKTITIAELANKMAIKSSQVIKTLINMGFMATINQIIDQETAQLVAEEMGHKVILHHDNQVEKDILNNRNEINKTYLLPRAPIVAIMGHVDHGKTSLLDSIRSTKIASTEAGGITQHIGAYHVKTKHGAITFLDTPGHAAFTKMRLRGTKITDIIVLVIAVDDGIQPQTIEVIEHAKLSNVPLIIALNKIDKPDTEIDHIKNELTKYNILSEDWGGEHQFIKISAKNNIGIDKLLEAILLQAEIMELKAINSGMASGIVIESYLDKKQGPMATIIVQEGILHKGNVILCGSEYGRIRVIRNEFGKNIQFAGPSIPVEILGLSNTPLIGDIATVVQDEKSAREVALYRQNKFKEMKLTQQKTRNIENIFDNIKDNKHIILKIILKTDVQGTCEAIAETLKTLSTNKISIKIIFYGVGNITENDVTLAKTSNAIIIGFNVKTDIIARKIAENEKLNLRYYSIIYHLIDDIKEIINEMTSSAYAENIIGKAEVRNVFRLSKFGLVAGCMITYGIIKRNNIIQLKRNNKIIYHGELESLRHFKNDVHELRSGSECGIVIKNYIDINIGDIIESIEKIKVKNKN